MSELQEFVKKIPQYNSWFETYENLKLQLLKSGKTNFVSYLEATYNDLASSKKKLTKEEIAKLIYILINRSKDEENKAILLSNEVAKILRERYFLWAECYCGRLFSPRLNEIGIVLPIFDQNGPGCIYYFIDDPQFQGLDSEEIVAVILQDQKKLIQEYMDS